jgi:hypothetical protein
MKEELDHVLRPSLPWREMNVTECGLDQAGRNVLSNEEFIARCKEYGQQRTAMVTCMTCLNTVQRWYRHGEGLTARVGREIDRVGGKWGLALTDGGQLDNEFKALQLLIEAHRAEFDETVATLNGATSLDQARAAKRAKQRYGA